jgi:hypothetical protein
LDTDEDIANIFSNSEKPHWEHAGLWFIVDWSIRRSTGIDALKIDNASVSRQHSRSRDLKREFKRYDIVSISTGAIIGTQYGPGKLIGGCTKKMMVHSSHHPVIATASYRSSSDEHNKS